MKAEDLGPLPKVHKRHRTTYEAQLAISRSLSSLRADYDLTEAEFLSIVLEYLYQHTNGLVRQERGIR